MDVKLVFVTSGKQTRNASLINKIGNLAIQWKYAWGSVREEMNSKQTPFLKNF